MKTLRIGTLITTVLALATLSYAGPAKTHKEIGVVAKKSATKCKLISAFCLAGNGNLLICDGSSTHIKVVSQDDNLVDTWKLPFRPEAICSAEDGSVFVAGAGIVLKLDAQGKQSALLRMPVESKSRPGYVADVCCSGRDVFISVYGKTGFDVLRADQDLKQPKTIITKLRGCCGQMDMDTCGEDLFVAENSRHHVVRYDRDGKELGSWGSRDRETIEGFGSCCNPMNLCVVNDQVVTAESVSPEARIKTYDLKGTYKHLNGTAKGPASCARVTLDATPDGSTLYMLDGEAKVIRILAARE